MSSSVNVNAKPFRVWEVLTEVSDWPAWSTVCTDVWNVPGDGITSVGKNFGFKLRIGGRQIPFNVSVTRVESSEAIEWSSTKFSITAVRTISVAAHGTGSRVVDSKVFSSPILPIGVAYPRWLIRRMTESWLNDIKMESERSS